MSARTRRGVVAACRVAAEFYVSEGYGEVPGHSITGVGLATLRFGSAAGTAVPV